MKLRLANQAMGSLVVCILMFLPCVSEAQESENFFTLQKSLAMAMENSYKLQAREEGIDQAARGSSLSRRGRDP